MDVLEKVKFNGKKIELQNLTLIIPPLNFKALRTGGALKKLDNVFKAFQQMKAETNIDISPDVLDDAIELVLMAARRNYPTITKEQIEEGLDFDSFNEIAPILLTQNKMSKEMAETGKNELEQ